MVSEEPETAQVEMVGPVMEPVPPYTVLKAPRAKRSPTASVCVYVRVRVCE